MSDTAVQARTGAEDVIWDLSTLYSGLDDPAIDSDLARLQARGEEFARKYRGRVASLSAGQMAQALREIEEIYDLLGRVGTFASLTFSTHTEDQKAGALVARYNEQEAELGQKLIFFRLEWLAADDETAQRILDDRAIGRYRHYLEAERRFKPYQLTEPEEQILMDKAVTGRTAWQRFYDQLMGAMRVQYEGRDLPLAEVASLIEDPDREVRRKAHDAIGAALAKQAMPLTYLFNVLTADKGSDDRRRGYPTWISERNLDNNIADEVVDALVQAVTSSYDVVERHYKLKQKLLGFENLFEYDRHAPLPIQAAEKDYSWDEARQVVLAAYDAFSPQMAGIVQRFFDGRWIHAPITQGKDFGAYCTTGLPSLHPYVLLNFAGKANDVGTLAHELGHGVHGYLSNEAQTLLNAQTPVTLAETASTFGEMLVFQDLMAREENPEVRLSMLSRELEYSFATVYRQIAFNRFEEKLHNARRTEGELSTERLTEFWLETIRVMFGEGLIVRDEYGPFWGQVSHFVQVPGYVYGYAFGKLLVLALYNLYKERGTPFAQQLVDLLAAGGSDYPDALLARIGVKLSDPAFWRGGTETLRQMVEQEETLARELYPAKFS